MSTPKMYNGFRPKVVNKHNWEFDDCAWFQFVYNKAKNKVKTLQYSLYEEIIANSFNENNKIQEILEMIKNEKEYELNCYRDYNEICCQLGII
jgi:hypothetical protein